MNILTIEELHKQQQEQFEWYKMQLKGQKRLPRKTKKLLKRGLQERLAFTYALFLLNKLLKALE